MIHIRKGEFPMSVRTPARSLAGRILPALVAMATLSGCGDEGPTVAESGLRLKADVNKLLIHIVARNIQIDDDGSRNTPCGKNKAKHAYAVRATKYTPGEDAYGLVDETVGAMLGHYKLIDVHMGKGVTPKAVMRNASARTTVTLISPRRSLLTVSGATDCLPVR
jgi:hypothetical protein